MALAHNLGFPRTGNDHALRARHWQMQKDAGIELLPVGDVDWQGGAVRDPQAPVTRHFTLLADQLLQEVAQASALGHTVKPVLVGPLTYLWQSAAQDGHSLALEGVDELLPHYDAVLNRLAEQGVQWVQIDEPILAQALPQDWKNAYERVYNILQRAPLKKLIATWAGGLQGNLGLAAHLPVDGLHIDLVSDPEQLTTTLDRLPAYKVLSLGLVDPENDAQHALDSKWHWLCEANERLGERLWIGTACSLLHSPLGVAVQACEEVVRLVKALNDPIKATPPAFHALQVANA